MPFTDIELLDGYLCGWHGHRFVALTHGPYNCAEWDRYRGARHTLFNHGKITDPEHRAMVQEMYDAQTAWLTMARGLKAEVVTRKARSWGLRWCRWSGPQLIGIRQPGANHAAEAWQWHIKDHDEDVPTALIGRTEQHAVTLVKIVMALPTNSTILDKD